MITFENVKKSYGDYIFDVPSMNIPQGIIIVLILLLVSYLVSYNVMKNKEY